MNSIEQNNIRLDYVPKDFKLSLCMPNKQVIANLSDAYNVRYNKKISVVNELSFTIPTVIENNQELIDNPLIKKIKHRYVLKFVHNHVTEYFVINEINKDYNDSESVQYKAYGLGYLLSDKTIKGYEATSKSLSEMLTDILDTSTWKVGYVDSFFDTKIRSHEIPQSNLLQVVYDLAEKFNGVIIWDTVNELINIYNPSNIGFNKGFKLKEGKYLESFNMTTSSDDIVTRLYIYGQDGLTIRKLTPTGANYLEDFSYFIYPFEKDENGNVLQKSEYMSDGLASNLIDYNKFLAEKQGEFDSLLEQLLDVQDKIQKEQQALSVLLSELSQLIDERDVLNATGDNADLTEINQRVTNKETEIANKEQVFDNHMSQEDVIQSQIDILRGQTSIEVFLTPEQILELNKFITEQDYTNDMIVDEEDLLEDGIEAFKRFRTPEINLTMSIYNFLNDIEHINDRDKIGLGDTISIYSKRLNVDTQAKIIEIEFDFENQDISLQIANEKDILDGDARLLDMIYNANNTSNTVNMNKFKWGLVEETNTMVNQILTQAWDATKNNILAGYKQNIVIGERGIVIKSPEQPLEQIVIQNGLVALTNDGGNTWKTAITPMGVYAEKLVGKIIIGSRLLLEDEDGIIKIDGSLQTVYDNNENERVLIGKYGEGKYGIKINSGALEIVNGLPESQINPDATNKWNNAEQNAKNYTDSKDNQIRGDLRLESPLPTSIKMDSTGITAYTSSNNNFARLDHRGLYVQGGALDIRTGSSSNRGVIINGSGISGYNSSGARTFHLDTNGNLTATTGTFSGNLSAAGGTFSGSLQAANGTFSGNLVAAGGTFSGNLSAAGGTFSGSLSAVSGTFTNLSSGTITGAYINGTEIRSQSGNSVATMADGEFRSFRSGAVEVNASAILKSGVLEFFYGDGNNERLSSFRNGNIELWSSDGNSFLMHSDGIHIENSAGNRGSFNIYANTSFDGVVNFSNATVTNLYARFG